MSKTSRYVVTVDGGEPRAVDLVFTQAEGRWSAELDGRQLEVRLDQVDPDGVIKVSIDGQPITLKAVIDTNGDVHLAAVDDESTRAVPVRVRSVGDVALEAAIAQSAPSLAARQPTLRSPITGIILQVLVNVGDEVEEDTPLLVLEAMKMETIVNSPCRGYVQAIHVAPDARVKTGEALVDIGTHQSSENTAIQTEKTA